MAEPRLAKEERRELDMSLLTEERGRLLSATVVSLLPLVVLEVLCVVGAWGSSVVAVMIEY